MANRRMFSLHIVDTDAFLDMPQSSQLLYFHLSMRADDDGFVANPKKVMRMAGVNDDDMKVLVAKRFILIFDSGVVVIKHWKIHNYIQNDRYRETKYLEEKSSIVVKENGSYTERIHSVSKLEPQVKISKVKISKDKNTSSIDDDGFDSFWKAYPLKKGKQAAVKAWKKLNPDPAFAQKIIDAVLLHARDDEQWTKDDGRFIPHASTFLNGQRWEDEIKPRATARIDRFTKEDKPF